MAHSKTTKFASISIIIGLLSITGPVLASNILVTVTNGECKATIAGDTYRCSIGKNGLSNNKQEGDGTTPIGEFALRKVFYRSDKIAKSNLRSIALPVQKIKTNDGWCDDPKDKQYNTLVDLNKFDLSISHENMYRTDDEYNIVIEVGYNDDPIVPNKGSAVFVRVAQSDYAGTRGSVAFSQQDLLKILAKLNTDSKLIIRSR